MQWAILICLAYIVVDLAGLREFASILNGTVGSVALGWDVSAILAVTYVAIYLAFVVAVPILLLAAVILKIGEAVIKKKNY